MRDRYEKSWTDANLKVLTSSVPREVFVHFTGELSGGIAFTVCDSDGAPFDTCDRAQILSAWAFANGAWSVCHKYDLRKAI